jgi:capsular polysaccharide biosynthesis protein
MSEHGAKLDTLSRPIAEAAVASAYIEKTRLHRSHAKFRLSDALLSQTGNGYKAVGLTATFKNYTITNVVLDSTTGLLFQDQLVIPETSYFAPEGMNKQRDRLIRLDDTEDYIIGYNNAHGGYQHWLSQCIPAIDWALRQKRTRGVRVVLPPLASWQEDILEILGYSHTPRLTLRPNTFYFLPRVEYAEFLNGTTSFHISLSVRDTARRIRDKIQTTRSPHPILYVPCSSPYYGTMRNEKEVLDMLRRRGVHVADSRLSTAERINLFKQADVVMGPLGQGLSDILFCNPGALLWEWMPRHHQNTSINRLAQTAEVDYWGDVFESDLPPGEPRQWFVDLDIVTRRLTEISEWLAVRRVTSDAITPVIHHHVSEKPVDEVMLAFESLGDNCEFGLVQRQAGVEPLGLFRFAGMHLFKIVAALEAKLEGIGTVDTINVYPGGEPGPNRRELIVHETWLDTRYHTFIMEGEIDPAELRQREGKRLAFLRRKMLENLSTGEKIWVWREWGLDDPTRLQPLLNVLRSYGPNTLLLVVAADDDHPSGTVERLDRDFIKGYVERLAPYVNGTDICYLAWFEMCENALALCSLDPVQVEPT